MGVGSNKIMGGQTLKKKSTIDNDATFLQKELGGQLFTKPIQLLHPSHAIYGVH